MKNHVRFSDQVQVVYPVPINASCVWYAILNQPITDEEKTVNRESAFQRKRIRTRALLHLKYLERKARRAAAAKKKK